MKDKQANQLTKRQAFVITCWTTILFMDYEEFWEAAQKELGEPIINIEFGGTEIWERLRVATEDDFYNMVPKKEGANIAKSYE